MKIVVAASATQGRAAFATLGEAVVLPEAEITAAVVRDADALVTRSKVRVDANLLEGSRVRFAGTCTAGTDHMDLDYLQRRGIAWSAAAGCNANSVAEYVTAALLGLARRHGFALAGRTIAIVGVGHVGTRVAAQARALGLHPLLNDPPLFEASGNGMYRPLDEILPQADIVTLHVPLLDDGPHPTRRLAGADFFRRCRPGVLFVNASRGEVVDSPALAAALNGGGVSRAVLDVFEHEPACVPDLLDRGEIITLHIAGYSFEGKLNGTALVYRALCQAFGLTATWLPDHEVGGSARRDLVVDAAGRAEEAVLWDAVRQAYDLEADDRAFRAGLTADPAARGRHFETLRKNYPERREFPWFRLRVDNASPGLKGKLRDLGFRLVDAG